MSKGLSAIGTQALTSNINLWMFSYNITHKMSTTKQGLMPFLFSISFLQ